MVVKAATDTEDEASKALAVRIFEENRQLREEIEQQKTVIADLQKRKNRSAAESARQRAIHTENPPNQALESPTTTVTTPTEAETPHFVGPWQRHCPNCGKENEHFKDEVVCDPAVGGCGTHVGAFEAAKKYKKCPNCGKEQGNEGKPLMKYVGTDPTVIAEIDKIVSRVQA